MAIGDLEYIRFPIILDVDAAADSVPIIGTPNPFMPNTLFDIIMPEILPMTGTGGKSKTVVVVFARQIA